MKYFFQCGLLSCLVIIGTSFIFAEEKTPAFQSTQNEFSIVLGQPAKTPQKRRLTKGVKGAKHEKGVAAIVDDYEKLMENPTARSLILFDFDSERIKPESYPILENLAAALQNQLADITIAVTGHTDNIGTDEYNLDLSERRANAVKIFLVERLGIQASRLIAKGFGEAQPLADNATAQARAHNRRVEFTRLE